MAPPSKFAADELLKKIAAAGDNYELAAQYANSILAMGYQHAAVFNARGLAFQRRGQFREALIEFDKARKLAPSEANLSNSIGVCLVNLNRLVEANAAFDRAIALGSGNANAHCCKAWVLEMLGDRAKAIESYERALAIDGRCIEALVGLAAIYAGEGEFDAAGDLARRALAIIPNELRAKITLGIVDLANRDYEGAERTFRHVLGDAKLDPGRRAAISGLLADALDGQDRADEAFGLYRLKNEALYKIYGRGVVSRGQLLQLTERTRRLVAGTSAGDWSPPIAGDAGRGPPVQHIFLVGFLRSGTTLLEQVLVTHPGVVALEEKDLLADSAQTFMSSDAGLRKLVELNEAALESHRAAYWRRVHDLGLEIEGKTFVDKLPTNTIRLPLIAKLFPQARILFALRDPRDVILSCFRRHLKTDPEAIELLDLEYCAKVYGAVMGLAQACREKIPLNLHVHRYEDLVENFDRTAMDVCRFVGVEWTDRLRDFAQTKVLRVRSPSGPQIRRTLNTDSIGRWRAYREHLAPVFPHLAPWIAQFGYPEN